ncbi:MAG TPA: LPXTG cell wall anchor domain-containing protein [Bacillota bacterium]|nr:LPXTG cell wall anchor domain-containing protein [Bacillota bacterium]
MKDIKVDVDVDEPEKGLPKTARNMYNYILIGLAILLLGLITIALTPRRGTHIKVRSGTKSIRQRAAFLIDIFSFP